MPVDSLVAGDFPHNQSIQSQDHAAVVFQREIGALIAARMGGSIMHHPADSVVKTAASLMSALEQKGGEGINQTLKVG